MRKNVYIMGICGSGMASLAGLFHESGYTVTGSDEDFYPPFSTMLENMKGITLLKGYKKENIPEKISVAVVGNVIKKDNPEAGEIERRGIKLYTLPSAVNRFFASGKLSIVVAGTHGKSTTTGMAGYLFTFLDYDPTYLVGAILKNTEKSYRRGYGHIIIVEGDEYSTSYFNPNPKMLEYKRTIGIITSIEHDHLDIYKSFDDYLSVFIKFAKGCDANIAVVDDPILAKLFGSGRSPNLITCGINKGYLRAERILFRKNWTYFDVSAKRKFLGRFRIQIPGYHNVRNALAVISLGILLRIPVEEIKKGLEEFQGMKRRTEEVWSGNGIVIVDDFAHHPTAIRETILGVKKKYIGSRLWAIFEPRSFSMRTDAFSSELISSLSLANIVIISRPFRDPPPPFKPIDPQKIAHVLSSKVQKGLYIPDAGEIAEYVTKNVEKGDVILLMSSGNFSGLRDILMEKIKKYESSRSKG